MYNPLSLTALGLPTINTKFDNNATFVRSHLVSPLILGILRALISLYCFTTIIVAYSWLSQNFAPNTLRDIDIPTYTLILGKGFIGKSFSFFTFLTFWSLAFYFGVSAFHTLTYAYNRRRGNGRMSPLHDSLPRSLQLLHTLWYTTITTYPFLVSIVFWCTMYGSPWPTHSRFTQWINISVHGLNSLFAIFEVVFGAARPPPFIPHLLVVLLGLSLYLGLAYLSKATEDFYVYEWMNPAWGWQGIVAHIAGYAAGMTAIYSLVWGAMWLREQLISKHLERKESVTNAVIDEYAWSETPSCSTSTKELVIEVRAV
ncbi:hypothetical protein HII31_08511 [Pseudocercospora fuligena]|uniref:FAR-17a/AIG1-like protein n=1 Tax=Pseudocercospora fuligena TaxID=685502 RepID=A0A8H6VG46_9PEZI|nr:hypothetical protein HII31_08511 [Pseudocercospora fuligena]